MQLGDSVKLIANIVALSLATPYTLSFAMTNFRTLKVTYISNAEIDIKKLV